MEKNARSFQYFPLVLIVALVLLAPFLGGTREIYGTSALCIVALIGSVIFLWAGSNRRPTGTLPLTVFVCLFAASGFGSASIHATIQQTLYFACCAAVAVVASSTFEESKWQRTAALGIAATTLVLGVMAVLEFRQVGGTWRVFTTFESPGYFGGYLVLALPVTLAVLLGSRSLVLTTLSGASWILGTAALLLTGTRVAILSAGAACAILIMLAFWTRALGKRQLALMGIALVLVAIAAHFASAPTAARLSVKSNAEQSESLPFRVATWKGTVGIIKAHPVLGTGAGTFELVFPRYTVAGFTRNAHNGYLQIASEAGIATLIAGAAAFVTLFLAGLRGLRREDDPESALFSAKATTLIRCGMLAALLGSLARNLMDSDLYNPAIGFTFWAFAGMVASRNGKQTILKLSVSARSVMTVLAVAMAVTWWLFAMGQLWGDEARSELLSGERLSALDSINQAIRVDPLRGDWWLFLGQMEVGGSAGDEAEWRKGIEDIKHAATLEPTRARNWIILGRHYADRGDVREALAAFSRGLQLDPHATSALLESARLLKGEASDRMYERMFAEEKSPSEQLRGVKELVNTDYAWAHYEVGMKLLRVGKKKEATKHFRSAIERLERWKANDVPRKAAEEAGLMSADDEPALKKLLLDCVAALKEAESGFTRPVR